MCQAQVALLTLGYGIWCSALVLLYALHALGCAFAWPVAVLRTVLAVVFLVHLVALGGLWRTYAVAAPTRPMAPRAASSTSWRCGRWPPPSSPPC